MYPTVITWSLSFLVFTFGSLLVTIQIAGGQIRACGANSLQIARRRLRAMIDNLLALLPAYRHAPLLQEK